MPLPLNPTSCLLDSSGYQKRTQGPLKLTRNNTILNFVNIKPSPTVTRGACSNIRRTNIKIELCDLETITDDISIRWKEQRKVLKVLVLMLLHTLIKHGKSRSFKCGFSGLERREGEDRYRNWYRERQRNGPGVNINLATYRNLWYYENVKNYAISFRDQCWRMAV